MTRSRLPFPQLAPLSVARMLWRQRYLVLAGWIVLAGAGAFLISHLPNVYSAEALVLVDPQRIPERFVPSTVQVSAQDQLATINQQILSSGRLQNIIDEFHLYTEERKTKSPEEVIALMKKQVKITPDKGWTGVRPGAFRIAYESYTPAVVASVVNRIADLFIEESLKTREQRAEGTSEFLDSQLQEARKNLEMQESILRQFKTRRMGELPEQEGALTAMLARLQAELQGNQDALGRSEQTKIMLESTLHSLESSQPPLLRGPASPRSTRRVAAGAGLDAQPARPKTSAELQAQLDALRLRYSEEHPDVRRLQSSLELALRREKTAEAAAASVRVAPEAGAVAQSEAESADPQLALELSRERERIASTKSQIAFANKEIEARNAERKRIMAAIADYQGKVERLPIREQELAAITRDYENSRQNYKSLLDKKLSAEMATAMERQQQSERFTLLDPAKVPTKPIKPNRPLFLAAAIGLALGVSFAVAFVVELPKNRLLGEWEIPSEAKVIGCISEIRLSPARQASGVVGPRTAFWLASLLLAVLAIAGLWSCRGAF